MTEEGNKNPRVISHPPLPVIERLVYWSIWVPLSLLPFYVIYNVSRQVREELDSDTLQPGWSIIPYAKDTADFEWNFWQNKIVRLACVCTVHSLGGLVMAQFLPQYRKHYSLVFSLVIEIWLLTYRGMLLIFSYFVVFYTGLQLRSVRFMWIMILSLIALAGSTEMQAKHTEWISADEDTSYLALFSLLMCMLRMISFGSEFCNSINTSKKDSSNISSDSNNTDTELTFTLLDYIHYLIYLPVFSNGPMFTYDKFCRQFRQTVPFEWSRIFRAGKKLLSVIFYSLCLDVFFHFIYAPTISLHYFMLEQFDCVTTASLCWVHLHIFCVKYYIFYRGAGLFLELDGLSPPLPPKCIASVYTFVEMWRKFDSGLYVFLQKYIYHPLGGSRYGIVRQTVASFSAFFFVGFWHGGDKTMLVWALTNWAGIFLESMLSIFLQTRIGVAITKRMSPLVYRRMCALSGTISVVLLIASNMVFLTGIPPTIIHVKRIFLECSFYCPILVVASLYMCNQCSIDVRNFR